MLHIKKISLKKLTNKEKNNNTSLRKTKTFQNNQAYLTKTVWDPQGESSKRKLYKIR